MSPNLLERARLPAFIALRVVLFATLIVLCVLAVQMTKARLMPQRHNLNVTEASFVASSRLETRPPQLNGTSWTLDDEDSVDGHDEVVPDLRELCSGETDLDACDTGTRDALAAELLRQQVKPTMGGPDSDVPGFDIRGVPRAEGMTRWMSFEDEGGIHQTVFYGGAPLSPSQTLGWYQAELQRRGWSLIQASAPSSERQDLYADRGNVLLLVQTKGGCNTTCVTVQASRR